MSALMHAAMMGRSESIGMLVTCGAAVNHEGKQGLAEFARHVI